MYGNRPNHNSQPPAGENTSFPLMQVAEIAECLAVLNISVMHEDIQKPTAASAQHIYSGLVYELMGAGMETLEGPKAALMGMMEFKELYSDALQFTMFFHHVRNLAETCGIRNFAMADLTRPDGPRMKHHLSGIMNFAKFRDERSPYQQMLQEQTRQHAEKAERLKRQLNKIEHAISEITAKSAADRPKTEEARKQNEAIRDELLELRNNQMKLSHEVEELKKERLTSNEQATGRANDLAQLNLQISSARSRLVQSPDRIKKHISEMSSTVASEKATLAAFQRKAREFGNRVDVINGLEVDMRGLIDLEKGIEEQRLKVEEARRSMMSLRARLDGKGIESQGLITKLQQLQRQLQNASDRQKRSEEMSKEMRDKAEKKINTLKEEYVVRRKEREVWVKQREQLLGEQAELDAEMKAWRGKQEGEMNELLAEYWTLRKQAGESHFDLHTCPPNDVPHTSFPGLAHSLKRTPMRLNANCLEDYMNTLTVKLGLQIRV